MIKKFIISFLCLTFILSNICINIVKAEQLQLTEGQFIDAFKKLLENEEEESADITIENNVITIKTDEESMDMKYDFTNKPTFTVITNIKKGMTYKQFENEQSKSTMPLFAYVTMLLNEYEKTHSSEENSANMALGMMGTILDAAFKLNSYCPYNIINDIDDTVYMQDSSKTKEIKTSEFPERVMEYVNDTYKNKITISDTESGIHSYDLSYEQTNKTEDSCDIISTLVIDTDGFYKKLNSMSQSSQSGTNVENNNQSTISEINTGNVNNTRDSNVENKTQKVNSGSDLPTTGSTYIVTFLTIILFIITVLIGIKLSQYKDIK